MSEAEETARLARRKKPVCAHCGRPLPPAGAERGGAFCSKRCATIDLGRWLSGAYALADSIALDEGDGRS
jgi:endogenous inhibitor of DNA gyrase (YacG/DUF329 family)